MHCHFKALLSSLLYSRLPLWTHTRSRRHTFGVAKYERLFKEKVVSDEWCIRGHVMSVNWYSMSIDTSTPLLLRSHLHTDYCLINVNRNDELLWWPAGWHCECHTVTLLSHRGKVDCLTLSSVQCCFCCCLIDWQRRNTLQRVQTMCVWQWALGEKDKKDEWQVESIRKMCSRRHYQLAVTAANTQKQPNDRFGWIEAASLECRLRRERERADSRRRRQSR